MTKKIRLAAAVAAAGAFVALPAAAAQAAPAPAPHATPVDCDFPGCDVQGGGLGPQGWNHWEYHQHAHGGPGWHEGDFGGMSTGSSGGPGGFVIG